MANIKGGEKRARQALKRRAKNRAERHRMNTIKRKLLEAVAANDKAKSKEIFSQFCSVLDKAQKHGVLLANSVNRSKSRACARVASIK